MPPATRKQCDYPGCALGEPNEDGIRANYVTPEGLATRADIMADYLQHVEVAHKLAIQLLEAQCDADQAKAILEQAKAERIMEERGPTEAEATPATAHQRDGKPKVESIPRPTIDEGVTESDWSFFVNQWD